MPRMSERLLIRLASDGRLTWRRLAVDARASHASAQGKPPAAVLAAAEEVIVLVPAEDVLLTQAKIGARNRTQLLQAVPYAVEENLLGNVEDLHFAAVPMADGDTGIAVVARARLREWIERLAADGIRADVMLPESLALAPASLLVEDGRVIARLAPWTAFACPLGDATNWLARVRDAGFDTPLDVHVVGEDTAPVPIQAVDLRTQVGVGDALAFFARQLGAPTLNLLHGEFAGRQRQARGQRWWWRAAALAAAVVVMAFAHRIVEVVQLGRSLDRIEAASAASLAETFPDLGAAERARPPELVMRARLEGLRGGDASSGLLRLLGRIAPILGATTRVQLRGLEFRNEMLEINLRAPDVQTLDSIREQVAATPGLGAELTATNPIDNATDGRLRIRAVAP